jgi:hypothetical protein
MAAVQGCQTGSDWRLWLGAKLQCSISGVSEGELLQK